MDPELRRLGTAIEAIWNLEAGGEDLRELRFGSTGFHDALATLQHVRALGGYKMVIELTDKNGAPLALRHRLWLGLHEIGHRRYGPGASEDSCNKFADIYLKTWLDPVRAYVETGDPAQLNSLLATMESVTRQAAAKRTATDDGARQFAAICRQHNVIGLEQAPNRCAPFVKFAPMALKALDPEVEALIRRLFPYGIKSAEMLAFVRSVLTRRKKYLGFVRDLADAGLIPATA